MITMAQLEQLKAAGKIKGFTDLKPKADPLPAQKYKKFGAKNKQWMLMQLQAFADANKLTLATEFQFHPSRKFRSDFSLTSDDRQVKILIEYEGIFSGSGHHNGHTSFSGYTKDAEKYNLAQAAGWKLLRYTANNYQQLFNDLTKLL